MGDDSHQKDMAKAETAWLRALEGAYTPSRRHIAAGAIVVTARSGATADGARTGDLEYARVMQHSPDANGKFAVSFEADDHECKKGLAEMLIFNSNTEDGEAKGPPQYNSDDENAGHLREDFKWAVGGCKFVPHWRDSQQRSYLVAPLSRA